MTELMPFRFYTKGNNALNFTVLLILATLGMLVYQWYLLLRPPYVRLLLPNCPSSHHT